MNLYLEIAEKPAFKIVTSRGQYSSNGTSFHGLTLKVNPNSLIEIIGDTSLKSNDGKTTKEWLFVHVETGKVITLYDYKLLQPDQTLFDLWSKNSITLHFGHKTEDEPIAFMLKTALESLCNAQ